MLESDVLWRGLTADIRLAFREARRHPSYALTAWAILAFGLALNTAIFSLVYFAVLKPLPFPRPGELVAIHNRYPQLPRLGTSALDYLELRTHRELFRDVGVYYFLDLSRSAVERPEKVNAVAISQSLLNTLEVKPLLGRGFTPGEEQYRGPHAMILSETYWQSQFARDPRILDRALELNGELYPVVGVMPASFQFPNDVTQMWVPVVFRPSELAGAGRASRYLHTYARLADGLELKQASSYMERLSREMARRDPEAYPMDRMGWRFVLLAANRDDDGSLRSWLVILFASVTCLLIIVCSNIAGLFLIRSTQRRFDLSLRLALGASRFRIARQVLVEAMLVGLSAGLMGLLIARTGIRLLVKFGPKYLDSGSPRLDSPVLLFGLGLSAITAVACGLYPAWSASRFPALAGLKEGGHQRTGSRSGRRIQHALIAGQVAVATALLLNGGLLIRSLARLLDTPPGFDPHNVLSMQISLPRSRYATPESQGRFYGSVVDQMQHLPGVESASGGMLPFGWGQNFNTFEIAGEPKPEPKPFAVFGGVAAGYFETLKIPVLRGRSFGPADLPGSEPVAVINDFVARRFLAGRDPLGRQIRMPWGDYRIVGVVGDVKYETLNEPDHAIVYLSASQNPSTDMGLVIRSRLPQQALVNSVQEIVARLDKNQPVYDVVPLEQRIDRTLRPRRFAASLVLVFAASGALLSTVGLYGLLSYTIALRRREIGIRMALGAGSGEIVRLIYRGGLLVLTSGVALGAIAAMLGRRIVATQLFDTRFEDPLVWAAVLGIISATCLAACAFPARQAARVNPLDAVRAE